jgi:hypothetical protein
MAGIIKIMWTALSELWIKHLEMIHKQHDDSIPTTHDETLRNKVRWMHSFQEQLSSTHPHYFQENLEAFLTQSSSLTLQSYISQYADAIQTALDGLTSSDSEPQYASDNSLDHERSEVLFPATREPTHRKRNRRRTVMTGIGR